MVWRDRGSLVINSSWISTRKAIVPVVSYSARRQSAVWIRYITPLIVTNGKGADLLPCWVEIRQKYRSNIGQYSAASGSRSDLQLCLSSG